MTSLIDSRHERPMWLRSGQEDLLAVLTEPEAPNDLGVVLLTGGGWMPATHRNRMFVDLARQLATLGCRIIRFDYAGVGESTGQTKVFDSMKPHSSDVVAAAAALVASGASRVVLVGTCYGGRTALAAAHAVPNLVGMVLSGVPVKDYGGADKGLAWHARRAWSMTTLKNLKARYPKYLRIIRTRLLRLFGRGKRSEVVSGRYLDAIQGVLRRGVEVLILEGLEDKHHKSFVEALDGSLGEVLRAHPHLVAIDEIDGELHGELWLESQAFTRRKAVEFVAAQLAGRD